jgi:hypothetical protein
MFISASFIFGLMATAIAAPSPGPAARQQLNDLAFRDLVPQNFTTSSGEVATVWVHKSWRPEPVEVNKKERRQVWNVIVRIGKMLRKQPGGGKFKNTSDPQNRCGNSSFKDKTSSSSPYTGGCNIIREFHNENKGYYEINGFTLSTGSDGQHETLMIAGSNSGANCIFGVKHGACKARIGNTDIVDVMRDANNKFAKFYDNAQRLAAVGTMGCSADCVKNGDAAVDWTIYGTKSPIS